MKRFISFTMLLLTMAIAPAVANADLVFSFRQQDGTNTPIMPGSSATFDIVVTSTVAGQTADGYDLGLSILGTGAGGQFTGWGNPPVGFSSGLWTTDPFAPTASFGTTLFTFTNTTTEFIAGRLTLTATPGSVAGGYAITWDQAFTVGVNPAGIIPSQFNNGTYVIGVPEPSGLLAGLVVIGGVLARRRRVA